jgi:phosphoadenosine phosphosulfate reductase
VPLIRSLRLSPDDLDRWERTRITAQLHAQLSTHRKRVAKSRTILLNFTGSGRCYAGVSWGKDSVAIAHMIATLVPRIPLVWIRVKPIENPDCEIVRDAFLKQHPGVRYEEIDVWCARDADGWHARGTLERGFSQAGERFGDRHISGIRGEESGTRQLRMVRFGPSTANTCAPIGWWSAWDVYAYLVEHGCPIHPAYACTQNGLWDPLRIRVASLGGKRGDGMGRREWEERYYGAELAALQSPREK